MKAIAFIRTGLVASTAISGLYFLFNSAPLPFEVDDAYMFLRYAKHFLSGHGFSWNVANGPAYGATSTLHLLAITAARGLTSLPDATLLIASSTAAGVLACGALVALGFLVLRDGALRQSWAPLAVAILLVTSFQFRFHSQTGMETMLSLLCNAIVAVSVVAFTRSQSTRRFALCVAAGYLSYLARPDNGATALLFPPLFFVASDRRFLRAGVVYAAVFGVLIVSDLFLKSWLFGDAIPLAFFAKRSGFYAGYLGGFRWNAAAYMLLFLKECLPWIVVIIAVADASIGPLLAAALLPVALTFGYYLSVTQIMGFFARFYFPFLPFVVLGAFVAIRGSSEDASARWARLRETWRRRAVLAAMLVVVTWTPVRDLGARAWRRYVIRQTAALIPEPHYVMPLARPLPYVGGFVNIRLVTTLLEQLPSGTVLAASEYGYLGSRVPNMTIVDLIGLHDRHIAHHGFSAAYLFSRNPDIIWLPPPDYSSLIKEILDSPSFAERYDYFPGVFEHGVALNAQSPRFASIKPLVERAFFDAYDGRRLSDYQAILRRSPGRESRSTAQRPTTGSRHTFSVCVSGESRRT